MDNYAGDSGTGIPKLLQTGWRLLFLTRDKALAQGYDTLEVEDVYKRQRKRETGKG